jgi:translation elongation factor EF-1alpha
VGEDDCTYAVAGDRVSISFAGLEVIQISNGSVLCDPHDPVPVTDTFRAQINTFELDIPITIGVPVVLHHLGTAEPAIIKILESVETDNGIKRNPRAITKNQTATVVIKLERSICVQTSELSKELSRFLLRRQSNSIASGVVTELMK